MILLFVVMAAMSIGLQSLLIWIGGLFPLAGLGLGIDAVIGMLLVVPIIIGIVLGSSFPGDGNLLLALLAVMGIYISIVFWFNWFVFIGCIALLWVNLLLLDRAGCDSFWLYCGACVYLLYCLGAYFAMHFNGIEVATDIWGIAVLSAATLCAWFKLSLE